MKKALLLGAASLLIGTAANAAPISGSLTDTDFSASHVTYSGSMPDNFFEDAGDTVTAQFSFNGNVTKTCAIQGVDGEVEGAGLYGNIDLGTIGISAGDDQAVNTLFTMTGPGHVQIQSAAAGCNYRNKLSLQKDSAKGLRNTAPGAYDSDQFQANIPYEVDASFTGVAAGAGHVPGTVQHVIVADNAANASKNFGAWRSPLNIDVNIPQVTGKGLVGGTYEGTLTVTLAIL